MINVSATGLQYTSLYVGSNKAFVNDVEKKIDDQNPNVVVFVENDRSYVPVRFITENFGGTVMWDEVAQTVKMNINSSVITLTVGKAEIIFDGNVKTLDAPPILRNERTYLPLRACVEAIGKKVFYDRGLILISDIDNILHKDFDADIVDLLISHFK